MNLPSPLWDCRNDLIVRAFNLRLPAGKEHLRRVLCAEDAERILLTPAHYALALSLPPEHKKSLTALFDCLDELLGTLWVILTGAGCVPRPLVLRQTDNRGLSPAEAHRLQALYDEWVRTGHGVEIGERLTS
jgi:hypothetical protein